jgi:hypothetical protein
LAANRLADSCASSDGVVDVTISVMLVDDQPLLRLGFRTVLDAQQ